MPRYLEMCEIIENNLSNFFKYEDNCSNVFNALRFHLCSYLECDSKLLTPIDIEGNETHVQEAMHFNDESAWCITFFLKFEITATDFPHRTGHSKYKLGFEIKAENSAFILRCNNIQDDLRIENISDFRTQYPQELTSFMDKIYFSLKPECENFFMNNKLKSAFGFSFF
jgi:hypothetical protein